MQSDLSFLSRRIKLVATDLDGTLLNRSHDVSERTVEAVRAASHKGLEVVICTGRRFASCLPILEKIKCADEVVVNNGIVVKDAKTQRTIDSMYMDAAVYRGALDILRRIDLPSVVLVDDFPGKDILIEAPEGSNEYHLEFVSHNSEYCSTVSELSSVSSDRLIEIVAFERYERLREAEVEIKKSIADSVDCFTIRGIRYKGCSLELMPKGASKWRAVQHIMKLRGVSSDEVLAIGDDVNDIEMIENAGFGVAMGNAFDEVKAVADYVTADRDEDGAAILIEKLLQD